MKRICSVLAAVILMWHSCTTGYSQASQKSQSSFTLQHADSLFLASAWKNAIPFYEVVLQNTPDNSLAWNRLAFCYHNIGEFDKALTNYVNALDHKPSPPLNAIILSRIARIYAIKGEKEKSMDWLTKAVDGGYMNVTEMETHKDFSAVRSDKRFSALVEKATHRAMPCLVDNQSREFDFWIGEWDVYPNGANVIVGHSKIEMASGGCMILENWTATGAVPNTGKSMNYVNPATKKWEQFWIGSGGINQNNPQKFVNGIYSDNAMRFDFEQVGPKGEKQIGRFIFFNEGRDQVRQFNEVSSDGGKTWTTVYDFVYKRKK